MSLFIGGLAFSDPLLVEEAKLGTLAGSMLAAIAGYFILRVAPLAPDHSTHEGDEGLVLDATEEAGCISE